MRAAKLAWIAGDVIAARMALAAAALADPSQADAAEFQLMISEKVEAVAMSIQMLMQKWAELSAEMSRVAMNETDAAREGLAALMFAESPPALLSAQANIVGQWYERCWANAAALTQFGLRAQSAVLAPVHRTATANAKRLRG